MSDESVPWGAFELDLVCRSGDLSTLPFVLPATRSEVVVCFHLKLISKKKQIPFGCSLLIRIFGAATPDKDLSSWNACVFLRIV